MKVGKGERLPKLKVRLVRRQAVGERDSVVLRTLSVAHTQQTGHHSGIPNSFAYVSTKHPMDSIWRAEFASLASRFPPNSCRCTLTDPPTPQLSLSLSFPPLHRAIEDCLELCLSSLPRLFIGYAAHSSLYRICSPSLA